MGRSRGIKVEAATQQKDLPHEFEDDLNSGMCDICWLARTEPRHAAWEQMHRSQRESANHSDFPREFGS